jgi:predicted nucleotidyltransferase component of viral defense system
MHRFGIRPETQKVLRELRDTGLLDGWYLSGGTGLSLQLRHRLSEDLDFFALPGASRRAIDSVLSHQGRTILEVPIVLEHRSADQIWCKIGPVQVTFLDYPFALRWPTIEVEGVAVADARAIALQEAYTIGRRLAARDYVDLAYILREGVLGLDEIIEAATATFVLHGEQVFSPQLFLQQLVATGDLRDADAATALIYDDESFESLCMALRRAVESVSFTSTEPYGWVEQLPPPIHPSEKPQER